MTYDQLLTLEAIIKTGSFKSASEYLAKTQPSLSQAIKKLEEEYQIVLFDRDSYRASLTKTGEIFYRKAVGAIETFRELETFAKELSKENESEINISLDAICPLEKLSPIFEDFFQPHITTSLNLNIDLLEGLKNRILNKEVDFAIGSMFKDVEEFEYSKLLQIEMIPVIATKHCESFDETLSIYRRIPQIILTSSANNSNKDIVGSFAGAKHWHTSDIFMKEQLITNGLGWGRLPIHQVEDKIKQGKLVEIENVKEIPKFNVNMYLIKNKTQVLGPTAKRLWEFISQTYAK
tara:strand:- start:23310 stop:24185 length:876 start_codon:yes stop_codon:yes gene_type:complete